MSNTRLIIKTAEVTPEGILIRSMEVIDGISGETLKVSKLTPELCEFLKCVELDLDVYFEVQKMRETNPAFTKLIDTYRLFI
jgi:hypothetical protein